MRNLAKRTLHLPIKACLSVAFVSSMLSGCGDDALTDLSACELDSMKFHITADAGANFVSTCMYSKGYDRLQLEKKHCFFTTSFDGYLADCFERRGIWRSIKQYTQKRQ